MAAEGGLVALVVVGGGDEGRKYEHRERDGDLALHVIADE